MWINCSHFHISQCVCGITAVFVQLSVQHKCDAERSPGRLAVCAVVLVLDSCCQCQDRLRAWMWPLKRCSETQRAGGPQNTLPRFHTYTAATLPEVTQLDSPGIPTIKVGKWHLQPVAMTTDDKKHPVAAGEFMEAARVPNRQRPKAHWHKQSSNFGSWLVFIHQSNFK